MDILFSVSIVTLTVVASIVDIQTAGPWTCAARVFQRLEFTGKVLQVEEHSRLFCLGGTRFLIQKSFAEHLLCVGGYEMKK